MFFIGLNDYSFTLTKVKTMPDGKKKSKEMVKYFERFVN
jgi:hypothetical protein